MAKTFHVNTLSLSGQAVTATPSNLFINGVSLITSNQTGQFVTSDKTGSFGGGGTSGNPTGSYMFQTSISSGISNQFVTFPTNLGSNPTILLGLSSPTNDTYVPVQVSGATGSGFYAVFADSVPDSSYILNVIASTTTQTGMISTIINYTVINSGSAVNGGGVSTVNVTGLSISGDVQFIGLGGTIISITGNAINISGGSSINTGNFVTNSQTGSFVTTNQTGGFLDNSDSGLFVSVNKTGNFITTAQTGGFITLINVSKSITWANPDGILTGVYSTAVWRCNDGSSILTGLWAWRVGGSGVFVNAYKNNTATGHLSKDMSIVNTGAWSSSGTIVSGSYNLGDTLILAINSLSGLPTSVTIQADFTQT